MFVDFDNVYTGLQALDPAAAKRFAEDPKHWTEALADGVSGDDSRRFLIRNCYLNPVIYSKYRPYWTRAGFRVIDCPSLTQRGKSSTDINLVLDAMDALSGAAHIEEFFVASADADFTSLVQRFRAADRMTTVIAAGAVAFAYREMADGVVESHDFVALLNGTAADAPRLVRSARPAGSRPAAPVAPGPASAAVAEVLALVRAAPGPVTGSVAAHRALISDPPSKLTGTATASSVPGSRRPAPASRMRRHRRRVGSGMPNGFHRICSPGRPKPGRPSRNKSFG